MKQTSLKPFLLSLLSSFRFSARSLSRQPAFVAVAVVALSLGIGANAAIFTVVDAVLLQPLPYDEPERLVSLHLGRGDAPSEGNHSYLDLMDFRDRSDAFEPLVAVQSFDATWTGEGLPISLEGVAVSAGFLDLLRREPVLGREFAPQEHEAGAATVVLITHGLWQRHFGGDRSVLDRQMVLDGESVQVVGVLPPGLEFWGYLDGLDMVRPLRDGDLQNRGTRFLEGYGRLADGVTLDQANAQLRAVSDRLAEEHPQTNQGFFAYAEPLHQDIVGGVESALWVLGFAVAMVLLIACTNVANMLLARGASRRRETAVRRSLGAGRSSIVALFLGEAFLLSFVGGVLGLVLAVWGVDLLLALAPDGLPRLDDVSVNGRALAATLGLVALTGLASGLLPAWLLSRRDPREGLAEGVRGGIERGGRLRSALVVAEIAASLVLLVGAGLLVQSFRALLDVDPGFDPDGVAVFEMELPQARYGSDEAEVQMFDRTLAALDALPQVTSAGSTINLPYSKTRIRIDLWPVGEPMPVIAEAPSESFHIVTEGYFETMGMRLLRGRTFGPEDDGEPRTIVVNRAYAETYWPEQDALGRRVMVNLSEETTPDDAYEVIGIVDDVRQYGLDRAPEPEMYLPQREWAVGFQYVVARVDGDPLAAADSIRRAVAELDAELPVEVRALETMIGESLMQRRFVMSLLTLLGVLALVLAGVGIYGVMAYSVSLRLREMSIRRALGAQGLQIVGTVLSSTLALASLGIGLGVCLALGLSRYLESLLFGVSATDPLTYAVLAASLAGVAALSGLGPARRATRVDPMAVLRDE